MFIPTDEKILRDIRDPFVEEMVKSDEVVKYIQNTAYKIARTKGVFGMIPDLEQEGKIACAFCAQTFDTARGVKFMTHAQYRIRGAMIDFMRMNYNTVHIPRRRVESGTGPAIFSINVHQGGGVDYADSPESQYADHREYEPSDAEVISRRVLLGLPHRDVQIVRRYYQDNMTMKEIADEFGVSESQISLLHKNICKKLRDRQEVWSECETACRGPHKSKKRSLVTAG